MSSPEALQILCVEDDDNIRAIIEICLRLDQHMLVTSAASGEQALQILRDETLPLNCILLDLHLPDMSVTDVMAGIRSVLPYQLTPVILLTATTEYNLKSLGSPEAPIAVILKPFDPLTLAAKIRHLLA